MYKFSKKSKKALETCHPDLQKICNEVIKYYDITILCGHRGKAEQEEVYKTGKSKAKWGQSAHNSLPSRAVDVCFYPVDWANINDFHRLYGIMGLVAKQNGIKIKWGGHFKWGFDGVHFELE